MAAPPDHFARFGLPRRYAVDLAQLDAAYERLSFAHHPDFVAGAPPQARAEAEHAAAALNEAYRILRSGDERAAYLLGLLAAGQAPDGEPLPPGFLQEMFGLQEDIENLPAGDSAGRAGLLAQVRERQARVLEARQALFARLEAAPPPAPQEALRALQANLNCARYLRRLADSLEART
jgi:molecular chaperone HscB